MMGVGKSTIGRILSRKLNMKFADIDKIIENIPTKINQKHFQNKRLKNISEKLKKK